MEERNLTEKIRRTQIFNIHKQTAKIAVFSGFEMPLWYNGIITEHLAVRENVGIFDISHMGRLIITGVDSEEFLNYMITNDVSRLSPNSALYSVMCTENGGIIDDFILYRLEEEKFLMVPNATNREKDYNWLVKNAEKFNIQIEEISDNVAMLAVQGQKAEKTLQIISEEDLTKIERFKCKNSSLAGVEAFVSRTGYTGEDGFEIFVWNASLDKPDNAIKLWRAIINAGKTFGIEPCGLGARDTLRLEAGLCLYGNDIDEKTTPLEAALSFVVKLKKDIFIGKTALQKQKSEGIKCKRVGIKILGHAIPRQNFEIYNGIDQKIGYLTSGTFSPLLKQGIGMGYVEKSHAQVGETIKVKIRGKKVKAQIASFPLYDPEKHGYKRKTSL